ncbi:RdgB/HAM1 family non-canonical purine NTP pyrophosphatase [bacterium]|nr:RdgB/HAM1 family non-canonical purine NTP pyrophosphatase [bacterium]
MKKTVQLIIASNNSHKISEIRKIFSSLDLDIFGWTEYFSSDLNVNENGITFEENAIKKLETIPPIPLKYKTNHVQLFLADDSGLEVEALDGRPGIHSARYAPEGTSIALCSKLLRELSGLSNRRANFTAAIALKVPDNPIQIAIGQVFGKITDAMSTDNGFGYDPVFIPQGHTESFAEMLPSQKNALSHRGNALEKLTPALSLIITSS